MRVQGIKIWGNSLLMVMIKDKWLRLEAGMGREICIQDS
jgi:hypothetical protein